MYKEQAIKINATSLYFNLKDFPQMNNNTYTQQNSTIKSLNIIKKSYRCIVNSFATIIYETIEE